MRRGILGGTFDPIHLGHLDVAHAAASALGLDEVLLIPARVPPHRRPPLATAPHRFAMVALAVQDRAGLLVSDIEMLSEGPSYTASTLDRLAAGGQDLANVFFLTGADAFQEIGTWKDYPTILDRCHFVAVSRPNCPAASLRTRLPALAGRMREASGGVTGPAAIFLVDAPTAAVSSTDVRRRLQGGQSIAGLVPASVAAHIARHGLYRHASIGLA